MSLDDLDGEHRDHLRYRWLVDNGYFRFGSLFKDNPMWFGAGKAIPSHATTLDEAIDQCIDNEDHIRERV